jgi:hypothetical protein
VSPLVVRHEDPPADAVVIIRGGLLAPDSIVRTATTSFERHGFYGVSVFAAIDMTVDQLVARTPELGADRYKQLRRSTVGELRGAGFALLPTLEWPHFDIVLPDVEEPTLERLGACFSQPFANPAGAAP